MKFYRLHRYAVGDGSHGYQFYTSRADAERSAKEWQSRADLSEPSGEVDEIEITPTKAGILRALNTYATHANNG